MGSYVEITASDGAGTMRAYLATPEKGSGPGLVLLQEIFGVNAFMKDMADYFAEEGYVVMVPDLFWRIEAGVELGSSEEERAKAFDLYGKLDVDKSVEDVAATIAALRAHEAQVGKVGAVGYCLGGKLAWLVAARTDIDAAVGYYGVKIEDALSEKGRITAPLMLHFAEEDGYTPPEVIEQIRTATADMPHVQIYSYPGADHGFARPTGANYDKPSAMMAYSRTLTVLRGVLGPVYDLSQLWDMHCFYEFAERDVDATMATMVAEPYVNHIPTMTGGVGHDHLKRFYKYHFVDSNPEDTKLVPISRTIGTDRLVDEMLFCFTHTREIDWMLPGVEPTGKYVEVPLIAIVHFRGDKLYNEHIYWDQASVLVQIGKLDPAGLPVAGHATAQKLLDPSLPSNKLMGDLWNSSEGKPI